MTQDVVQLPGDAQPLLGRGARSPLMSQLRLLLRELDGLPRLARARAPQLTALPDPGAYQPGPEERGQVDHAALGGDVKGL